MIEPEHAYTVLRRPLMPPKPERIMPMPKLSMEEDAKLCNRRMWAAINRAGVPSGNEANADRHRQAKAEREALAAKALALIIKRPRTVADLRELLHASDHKLRAALGLLRSQGQADCERRGAFAFWEAK